jgi:bifunctional UDP-N-acetylglucosamine pyrophosphorylase/glucosamine-1-phosphate N-acetyltransferase
MQRMLDRLAAEDHPAAVVVGFPPADPLNYGRILADERGNIRKMVEHKDATEEEREVNLCNSGLMAARAADLWPLLSGVGNDNAAGEYYLPDIVMLAAAVGRLSAVIETDTDEVSGVNSRAELAALESLWQRRRRASLMAQGVTLVAPEPCGSPTTPGSGATLLSSPMSSSDPASTSARAPASVRSVTWKALPLRRAPRSALIPGCARAPRSAKRPRSAISSR